MNKNLSGGREATPPGQPERTRVVTEAEGHASTQADPQIIVHVCVLAGGGLRSKSVSSKQSQKGAAAAAAAAAAAQGPQRGRGGGRAASQARAEELGAPKGSALAARLSQLLEEEAQDEESDSEAGSSDDEEVFGEDEVERLVFQGKDFSIGEC
eukprot:790264-Pelagomonas_calceolata.AAC.1